MCCRVWNFDCIFELGLVRVGRVCERSGWVCFGDDVVVILGFGSFCDLYIFVWFDVGSEIFWVFIFRVICFLFNVGVVRCIFFRDVVFGVDDVRVFWIRVFLRLWVRFFWRKINVVFFWIFFVDVWIRDGRFVWIVVDGFFFDDVWVFVRDGRVWGFFMIWNVFWYVGIFKIWDVFFFWCIFGDVWVVVWDVFFLVIVVVVVR